MWRRYCCLTNFFPIVDACLSCKDITWHSSVMVHRWRIFASWIFKRATCSILISDLHPKFTLRPHHVWKYGRQPICNRWEQAKKKRRMKIETTAAKTSGYATWLTTAGGHNYHLGITLQRIFNVNNIANLQRVLILCLHYILPQS